MVFMVQFADRPTLLRGGIVGHELEPPTRTFFLARSQ